MSAYDDLVTPEDKEEIRDLSALAAQLVGWVGPASMSQDEALAKAWEFLNTAAGFVASIPTITNLAPATMEAPGPDAEMIVTGTGFTAETVIVWSGADEPTDFVSETEVKTTVKPSTVQAPLPFALPVYVRNAGVKSNVLEFTFTEAPPLEGLRSRHGKQDRA